MRNCIFLIFLIRFLFYFLSYQNRGPYRPNVSGYGGNRMTKNSFAGF